MKTVKIKIIKLNYILKKLGITQANKIGKCNGCEVKLNTKYTKRDLLKKGRIIRLILIIFIYITYNNISY